MRIGVLVSHPIQYFVPVYRELSRAEGVELTVLYRTRVGVDEYYDEGFGQPVKWDIPLLGGYQHCFLSGKNVTAGFEWSVVRALLGNRFDVLLVHGYNSVTNVAAILLAKVLGTKVLMRGDTRLQRHHRLSIPMALVKRQLFKLCDGFVTIGTHNRAYYEHFGVIPERIFFAPFCVENDRFVVPPDVRVQSREAVRKKLGLDADSLIIICASKLIKLKRTDELILAFSMVAEQFPSACLVIAGSGDEELSLRHLAEAKCPSQVRFIGFQNQSQLPNLYAAADVFVLPSHLESWGLVVNEVMAAGLPVIVSSEVGAAPDLVEGQGTGIVFPCGDVEALASALRTLLAAPDLRRQMAARGIELIRTWDLAACATGIVSAAKAVAANG